MGEAIAELAAARMQGSPTLVSCRRLPSGFANSNYRLETSTGVFLLRHRPVQDRQRILFELDVLDWLRTHRFPAPGALDFQDGHRWVIGPNGSHLVLLEWLEGEEPELRAVTVRTIGRALGDLHLLPLPSGNWWRRENPVGGQTVGRLADSIPADAPDSFRFFADEYSVLVNQLNLSLPRGFIHGDLFADNTLFRGHKLVAMLDFEDACEDALLVDLAMTVHGFCFPDEHWSPHLAELLVGAYSERRPLNGEERDALPTYLRWCPLVLLGWHLQELLRRPNVRNEDRAAELCRRITTMREANWAP